MLSMALTLSNETKGGKQIEIEYSKEHGKQSALHIIMKYPNLWVV